MNINLHYGDCMDFMRSKPDKFYDWAVVDPPYFSGPEKRQYYGQRISNKGVKRIDYPVTDTWEVPTEEYFIELFRVSKNQIIWGCNYYNWKFNPGRIVWDKVNGDSSFSDCELAFCSVHDSIRIFRFMWNGMMQGESLINGTKMQGNKKLNEKKIHPTQKPVALYKWTFQTYIKPKQNILDTHGGSFSSAIAAYDLGLDMDIIEKNKIHFNSGKERFDNHVLKCEEIRSFGYAKTAINKASLSLF